jgi:hypothetical protein
VQARHEAANRSEVEVSRFNVPRVNAVIRGGKRQELREVASVGIDRMRRYVAIQSKIFKEVAQARGG